MYDGQMDTADIANEKLKHEMNVWRGASSAVQEPVAHCVTSEPNFALHKSTDL